MRSVTVREHFDSPRRQPHLYVRFFELSKMQQNRRQYQQIQKCRCYETANNNRCHRSLDFTTGLTGPKCQRHQPQSDYQRRHQYRGQALGSTTHGGIHHPPGLIFCFDQMLVVRNQHDRITQSYSEQGHETEQRTQRQPASGGKYRDYAANKCERQIEEGNRQVVNAVKAM